MPYIEAVTAAGRTVEIERYYTERYGRRGQTRADRVKPTTEQQARINNRQAEKKLRRILNANFKGGDMHIVLSYARKPGEAARNPEAMKKDIELFLRKLRKRFKAAGKEMKYIHVAEVGSKGARHHHVILSAFDIQQVQDCWNFGRIHVNPLDDSGQYAELAAYLIKYTGRTAGTAEALQGKRWNASKNLVHPVTEKVIISGREWFRTVAKIPHRYKGRYYIDKNSIQSSMNSAEYSGYGFFRFTLIELDAKKKRKSSP